MARPGVTYLDVSNAAQQLVAAGRMPTIETIRIALGTGSNSTLGPHLRAWKSKQDQTQQIAVKENIPEELISALKGVWERVINHSDDKIQAIQQETHQELIHLKQEVQRLQKDNAYWQQQSQKKKQERDELAQEKLAVEQLLTNAKIEIVTLSEKLIGTEQQRHDKQVRIDELHRQNQQIQANLEYYRNASLEQRLADQQRYEHHQKQLEQTIQKINQELSQHRQESLTFQKQYQQITFENGSLKAQLDKLHAQHEVLTTRLTDTLSELTKKTQDQQHWKKQFEVVQKKYDEQSESLIDLKTQNAMLLQLSLINKSELNELRDQNKVFAHEKWELVQEKAQLFGQVKQLQEVMQT